MKGENLYIVTLKKQRQKQKQNAYHQTNNINHLHNPFIITTSSFGTLISASILQNKKFWIWDSRLTYSNTFNIIESQSWIRSESRSESFLDGKPIIETREMVVTNIVIKIARE